MIVDLKVPTGIERRRTYRTGDTVDLLMMQPALSQVPQTYAPNAVKRKPNNL